MDSSSNTETPLKPVLSDDSDDSIATPAKKPVISWTSVFNPSGENLVFGSVKLSEFLSVQELEDLIEQEKIIEEEAEYFFGNQQQI
jgi:hypothetical protein